MKASAWLKGLGDWTVKHSPALLTGLGIGLSGVAVGLGIIFTPKAIRAINDKKMQEQKEKLTPVETVKVTWKYYIPALAAEAGAIACILSAKKIDAKRYAAVAAAYSLAESKLLKYEEKITEVVGEKKATAIKDAVAEEVIKENPVTSKEVLITDKGETLFYDSVSGRYFKGDRGKIEQAVNELNRRMISENWISLNDFYYEIGLPRIAIGDDLGWNVNTDLIKLYFSTQWSDDGRPCGVLEYRAVPRYNYKELY